jgi:hypothetical protein
MLERARAESLVAREQRRFVRQMHAHTAQLLRSAGNPGGDKRGRPDA